VTVYLVGAGPGDPELLTLKAARVLATADVLIHDRLTDPRTYDLVPKHCERIDVGKRPGVSLQQESINDLLVLKGRLGINVVRLKGGDPYVFGRGGEEALALQAHGIAYEVIPGISSCIAAPEAAGVPVTHRGLAASFTVVTGHRRIGEEQATNWEALAQVGGTIVVLMGVEERGLIATRLMNGGLVAGTPVAAIRRGTHCDQQVFRMRLDELAGASLQAPTTLVIGAVAALDLTSSAWIHTGSIDSGACSDLSTAS
jgi:uroporphyrin-III C-methyltransferase